jgi:hypothetical protein
MWAAAAADTPWQWRVRCKSVTGVELSAKMLELALREERTTEHPQCEFYDADWHLRLAKMEMTHAKNCVCNMTPAIQSA